MRVWFEHECGKANDGFKDKLQVLRRTIATLAPKPERLYRVEHDTATPQALMLVVPR